MAQLEWECANCTYINATLRDDCELCLAPSPFAQQHPPAAADQWGCPNCTLRNDNAAPRCEACLTPNPALPPEQQEQVGQEHEQFTAMLQELSQGRVRSDAELETELNRALTDATAEARPAPEVEPKPSSGKWEHDAILHACSVTLDPENTVPYLHYVEVLHAVLLSEGEEFVGHTRIPLIFSGLPTGADVAFLQQCHASAVAYFARNAPATPEQTATAQEIRRAIAREWAAAAAGSGKRSAACAFLTKPAGEALFQDVSSLDDPACLAATAEVLRVWGNGYREEMRRADPCDAQLQSLKELHRVIDSPKGQALALLLRAEVLAARRHQWLGSQFARSTVLSGLLGRPLLNLVAEFIVSQTPKYPTCPPEEVVHSQSLVRQSLNKLREGLQGICDKVLRDPNKDAAARKREAVLDWFAAAVLGNADRCALSPQNWQQKAFRVADDVTMLNLALVVLRLLAPAIEKNAPISLDAAYHDGRLRLAAERRLGDGFELPQGAPPAFNFSTDIYLLALKYLQVAVLPAVSRFRWLYEQYGRMMEAMHMSEDQAGGLAEQAKKLAAVFHAQQLLVEDPELLEKANQLCLYTCKVLLQRCQGGAKEQALAGFPSFVVDTVVEWFAFLCQFCPAAVQGMGGECKHMVDFTIFAMNSSKLLRREKRTQAKLVMVLNALRPQDRRPQELSFGNAFANYSWGGIGERHLFHIVEESPLAQRHLPEALMTVYVGVEKIEGMDVDSGDQSLHAARDHALSLLRHINIIPTFKTSLMQLLDQGSETLVEFVKSLVNDSIHCLDDALSRLREARDLQQAMKDREAWHRQPAAMQQSRKQHFQAQERSSRGFMRSAVHNIEALQMFIKPYPTGDYLSPAFSLPRLMDQLAHLVVHFLAMLAGPRCDALQDLETPKKYDYDRLGLLHMIVIMVVHLGQSPNLVPSILRHEDLSMDDLNWALEKVNSTGIGGLQTKESFSKLMAELTAKYTPPAASSGPGAGLSDEAEAALVALVEETVDAEQYAAALRELQVGCVDLSNEADGGNYGGHVFHQNIEQSAGQMPKAKRRKLMSETKMLNESGVLPLRPEASVFVCTDETRMDVLRAIVTGPEDTPYAFGCFVMDIFCPADYPAIPPMVNLVTTGGGTVRFNPNLYESGKICLSLLGTWHGDDAYSKWDAERSSIYQVLASIQGMILVPEPYFNEPAYERQQGTPEGKRYSQEYNERIQVATLRHTVLAVLERPPLGLEEVVRRHFKLSRGRIARQCQRWLEAVGPEMRERMVKAVEAVLLALAALD